jgi:exodeoxyribonuclease VII small subunit
VNKKIKSADAANPPDLEKSLGELEKIVARLEGGELTLDESLKQFERGVELTRQCQTALAAAEQKVEVLMRKSGDQYAAEPFESDADEDETP